MLCENFISLAHFVAFLRAEEGVLDYHSNARSQELCAHNFKFSYQFQSVGDLVGWLVNDLFLFSSSVKYL